MRAEGLRVWPTNPLPWKFSRTSHSRGAHPRRQRVSTLSVVEPFRVEHYAPVNALCILEQGPDASIGILIVFFRRTLRTGFSRVIF